VKELARNGASGETDPVKAAYRLERYVSTKLKTKNFSTALASAAEVAASLEGDCTEHAMLLAAMLRARQIPSRVAVGLVYVESVQSFGGHMWTEALLNGAWIPLDATLGQGGIGGGHIKLADSNMADDSPVLVTAFLPLMEVLGKMKIEVLRAE
jgi:transglutaminase-like putative cysteine protease